MNFYELLKVVLNGDSLSIIKKLIFLIKIILAVISDSMLGANNEGFELRLVTMKYLIKILDITTRTFLS